MELNCLIEDLFEGFDEEDSISIEVGKLKDALSLHDLHSEQTFPIMVGELVWSIIEALGEEVKRKFLKEYRNWASDFDGYVMSKIEETGFEPDDEEVMALADEIIKAFAEGKRRISRNVKGVFPARDERAEALIIIDIFPEYTVEQGWIISIAPRISGFRVLERGERNARDC